MNTVPKIAMLWWCLPAYMRGCVTNLSSKIGDNLWCASIGDPPEHSIPPPLKPHLAIPVYPIDGESRKTAEDILRELEKFKPQVLIASGWALGAIRMVAHCLKSKGVLTVCASDTPWSGTIIQSIRCVEGRMGFLRKAYDVMWVPGSRAARLARLAGFSGSRLWENVYTADTQAFSLSTERRLRDARAKKHWPRRFLFVGRLCREKNIKRLIEAYKIYRSRTSDPWELVLAGDGPLGSLARSAAQGISCAGWVTSTRVAEMMAESGCLVLPSLWEPWGVAAHEAAASGLPLALSRNVGSSDELLRDRDNGRIFDAHDTEALAEALIWISGHPEPWTMGERSYEISRRFSPELWSEYAIEKCSELLSAGETGSRVFQKETEYVG